MSKIKGTRCERELLHLFYDSGLFAPARVAGSGSTTIPAPDLIVGSKEAVYAIECKALKKDRKYLEEADIAQLKTFAEKFNAIPSLAMRFDREGWYFLNPDKLEKTKNNFVISLDYAKTNGLSFEELIKAKNLR